MIASFFRMISVRVLRCFAPAQNQGKSQVTKLRELMGDAPAHGVVAPSQVTPCGQAVGAVKLLRRRHALRQLARKGRDVTGAPCGQAGGLLAVGGLSAGQCTERGLRADPEV